MRIGRQIAHFRVEDGKPTAVPLPYCVAPLLLNPEVTAEIARLLAAPRSSQDASASAAKPIGGPAAAAQAPGSTPPTRAIPAIGSGIASYALPAETTPGDWSSLLFLRQSLLGPSMLLADRGQLAGRTVPSAPTAPARQQLAPLDPQSWLRPKPSEALKREEMQPLSPGLWLRPLPVSAPALANAAHLLAATQIGLEAFKPLGFNPPFWSPLNAALDGGSAVVALAEIVQETARPTAHGVKRLLYYLKRLLYVAKFITDVAPVSPAVQHTFTVVGLVVKGTDELHSVRLTTSRMQRLS